MEASKSLNSTDDNSEDEKHDLSEKKNKHKKSKKKYRKRKYSSSSEDSDDKATKKLKNKHKKKCKKRHKHAKDEKSKDRSVIKNKKDEDKETIIGPEIPAELLQKAQSMAPMSKEEWEKKQNTIRRVFDEKSGRTSSGVLPEQLKTSKIIPIHKKKEKTFATNYRPVVVQLVRGEGEIIEEIVSRERHQEINRQATLGDGEFFQSKMKKNI